MNARRLSGMYCQIAGYSRFLASCIAGNGSVVDVQPKPLLSVARAIGTLDFEDVTCVREYQNEWKGVTS